jgi:hypothetical protein
VKLVEEALEDWEYKEPLPSTDTRFIGSLIEESIQQHIKMKLPNFIVKIGKRFEYPDITIIDEEGKMYAFEVKSSPRKKGISTRVKSPKTIYESYHKYKEHWVIMIFYTLTRDRRLKDVEKYFIELWKYASATFKNSSMMNALSSLDLTLRYKTSETQFRSEEEFLNFMKYMAEHHGSTSQRNEEAKKWLKQYRSTSL